MGNHYHLEVETPEGELSRPLHWVNHRSAGYVNRTHHRVGHLFQGRFKSAVSEEQAHLRELTRDIHLTPVRARPVKPPGDYRWSSYRAYLGLRKTPPWLDTVPTLRRVGETQREQGRASREFVERWDEVVQAPRRELAFGAALGTTDKHPGAFASYTRLPATTMVSGGGGALGSPANSCRCAQMSRAKYR